MTLFLISVLKLDPGPFVGCNIYGLIKLCLVNFGSLVVSCISVSSSCFINIFAAEKC